MGITLFICDSVPTGGFLQGNPNLLLNNLARQKYRYTSVPLEVVLPSNSAFISSPISQPSFGFSPLIFLFCWLFQHVFAFLLTLLTHFTSSHNFFALLPVSFLKSFYIFLCQRLISPVCQLSPVFQYLLLV
jgi:hypothetical protein